jgi:hypothetical protein
LNLEISVFYTLKKLNIEYYYIYMMESLEMMMGENSGVLILQLIIIGLAVTILIMLYSDSSSMGDVKKSVDNLKCVSECPQCPDCPDCVNASCPDCVCNEGGKDSTSSSCPTCPSCPSCPSCPTQNMPNVDDIVDAIFPGRNSGLTTHGNYFPLDGLGEGVVEPAYSPVTNLMPNYVGGDGVPSAISFSDQTLLSKNSSIGLATQKDPPLPMSSTQGVMSQQGNTSTDSSMDSSMDNLPMTPPDSPENSDDEDSNGKDSNGKDSNGKDSNGKDSNGKDSNGKDSNGGLLEGIEGEITNLF